MFVFQVSWSGGPLWGVCVSLSAVNLSESAEGKIPVAQRIQIFVMAAISLRSALGKHLTCLPVSITHTHGDTHSHIHTWTHTLTSLLSVLSGLPAKLC